MNMAKELEKLVLISLLLKIWLAFKTTSFITCICLERCCPLFQFNLHTHEGSGNPIYTYGRAVDAGVDVIDLAYSAFANGTSQPSMNSM